jgi:outer membrane lipoprotein carrier protein
MKKITYIITILMICTSAFALTAKDVLENLQSLKSYTADFVQYTEIEGFGEDEYKGKLHIEIGNKALWDYSEPYRQFYLFDMSTMHYYDSDTRQLVIQSLTPANNVFMRLMLNPKGIEQDFSVSLEKEDNLVMTPKNDIGIDRIVFIIKNRIISGIITKDQNGNNTRVELKNIRLDADIPESIFSPEVPKGTEVFRY